jgi:hypothetical protein
MVHQDAMFGVISSLISSDLLIEHCRYESRMYFYCCIRDCMVSGGELPDQEMTWTSE